MAIKYHDLIGAVDIERLMEGKGWMAEKDRQRRKGGFHFGHQPFGKTVP